MIKNILTILALALLLCGTLSTSGQSNYEVANDHFFLIVGNSTIRDWKESVDDVDGTASVTQTDQSHIALNDVRILIRTNSIRSIGVEGNAMNQRTYKTLKTDRFPVITFMITSQLITVPADGVVRFLEVTGILSMTGVDKKIKLHPAISADQDGNIKIQGAAFLKMSDFGIDPPSALFGLLKVSDEISVQFNMKLIPSPN